MNIKSKYFKLFAFSCTLLIGVSTYGQKSLEKKEFVIPIVQYEPYSWRAKILETFQNPKAKNIKLVKTGSGIECYIYNGVETYHGIRKWENEYAKINIDNDKFSLAGFPDTIMQMDSIFILALEPRSRFTAYEDVFPIKYYGMVNDGKIQYYEFSDPNKEPLLLSQVIEKEYSSIENYKQKLIDKLDYTFDHNRYNGIYEINKDAGIKFLRQDFSFYEDCFPEQEEQIIELFFNFLDKSINYLDGQKENIRFKIKENLDKKPEDREPIVYKHKEIIVLNSNISSILKEILSDEQYSDLMNKDQIRKELKHAYIEGPLFVRYIKVSDDKSKSEERYVWSDIEQRAIPVISQGEYRRASREEQLLGVKEEVFGK